MYKADQPRTRSNNSAAVLDRTRTESYYYGPEYEPARPPYVEEGQANIIVQKKNKSMSDVVIDKFLTRSKAGEIFNNPMTLIESELDAPLADVQWIIPLKKHPSSGTGAKQRVRNFIPGFSELKDTTNLQNNAVTDAYSNVSANDGNTLLWLGEFKETLSMLKSIGDQLKKLHESTKAARKAWAKGKLSVKEQQSLTLAIVFGILPIEQSIADFMEGLFSIKDPQTRHTARGVRVDTSEKVHSRTRAHNTYINEVTNWSEHTEIVVRAGVLYEIDTDDLPWITVILDPKSVVSTAYALARMSFVIDWFVNVGGTLAAWSPSFGVNELSAWVTVDVTRTIVGNTIYLPNASAPARLQITKSEGKFKRVERRKTRIPVNRSDLALIPRIDINLNFEKIMLLVLLFAKIK